MGIRIAHDTRIGLVRAFRSFLPCCCGQKFDRELGWSPDPSQEL